MHPQIQFLLDQTNLATPFASPHGQAFLSLPFATFSHQVCPVHSPRLRDWLIDAFYREHREPPTPYALRQTIRTLAARATQTEMILPVNRRVAARGDPHRPDAILLHLNNSDGEIVAITPQGWEVTTDLTAAFLQSRGNNELPEPRPPALATRQSGIVSWRCDGRGNKDSHERNCIGRSGLDA